MPRVDHQSASNRTQPAANIAALLQKLDDLHQQMRTGEGAQLLQTIQLHHTYRQSAENLLTYLSLRRHDLRSLQLQLADLGLSSLAGCEAYCLNAVENVIGALRGLTGQAQPVAPSSAPGIAGGRERLLAHTEALLGSAPDDRAVRIMVTLPDQASDDASMVRDLLAQGMNCARINCAHGNADSWSRMIDHVRSGADALGCTCNVMMDLAGPKLRTEDIEPETGVLKVKPERNRFGQVTRAARLWLAPQGSEVPPAVLDEQCPWIEVPAKWLAGIRSGDTLKLHDARGSKRALSVAECTSEGCWAKVDKTVYLTSGLKLKAIKNAGARARARP